MFQDRNRSLFGKKIGAWKKKHRKDTKKENIILSSFVIEQLKETTEVIFKNKSDQILLLLKISHWLSEAK